MLPLLSLELICVIVAVLATPDNPTVDVLSTASACALNPVARMVEIAIVNFS